MPLVLLRLVVLGSSAEGLSALPGRSHRAQGRDDGGPHAGYSPSRAPTIPGLASKRDKPPHRPDRAGRRLGLELEPPGHPDRDADLQVAVEDVGVGRVEPDAAVAGGLLVHLVAGDSVERDARPEIL